MKLYFAYGANMWKAQMLECCTQSRRIGVAQLSDWRWIVSSDGYVNVIPSKGDDVQGVLFEIGAADETVLDSFEEVATGAYHKRTLPLLFNDRTLLALCYVSSQTTEGMATAEYGRRLLTGFADAGLDNVYLKKNVRRFLPTMAA